MNVKANPHADNSVIRLSSDKFFNDPDSHAFFTDMGMDVEPVDVFGAIVPQNKNTDLKKVEKNIQHRFQLEKPE